MTLLYNYSPSNPNPSLFRQGVALRFLPMNFIRSHSRGRKPQAYGPRGSIEIATLSVKNSRGNKQICAALVWNFRRWVIVLRLYLSALLTFPSVFKYLDKQCKHSGGMSQC